MPRPRSVPSPEVNAQPGSRPTGTSRRVGYVLTTYPTTSQTFVQREILALEPALWTFVHEEGVEPTNNAGERIVRAGVLWRKRSFGTDSTNGSRFVERILTVVATLRLQKRNVLDYATAACEAALHGRPAPSLLPM